MALWNDVFRQQVWEWFCGDMDSCLEVRKDIAQQGNVRFKGGMNFTVALITLSLIDLIAGYYCGKEPGKRDTAMFLQKYFGKHFPLFLDIDFSEKFYEVFRNGLSHNWSPKFGAISMDFGDWLLGVQKTPVGSSVPYLNAIQFYNLTKAALGDYEQDINLSSELQSNFVNRYNQIIKNDPMAAGELIKHINRLTQEEGVK